MALLGSGQQVPFMGLSDILHHTTKIEKGLILEPRELNRLWRLFTVFSIDPSDV